MLRPPVEATPHLGRSVAEFLNLSVNVGLREIGNTIRACSNRPLSAYFVEKVAVISAVFILVILTADLLFRPICWAARLSGVLRCQIIL